MMTKISARDAFNKILQPATARAPIQPQREHDGQPVLRALRRFPVNRKLPAAMQR